MICVYFYFSVFMPYLLETRNLLEISVNTEVVRASSSAWRTIQDEKTNGLGPGQTPYFEPSPMVVWVDSND